MTEEKKIGVLYIVFNDAEMLEECVFSAASLKKNSPGIPCKLITNLPVNTFKSSVFDQVDYVNDATHPLKAKVKYLVPSGFDVTLFLDADTKVLSDLKQLFETTGKYDLALTHDNHCDWDSKPIKFISQESEDINTGFILYRDTSAVNELFAEWLERLLPQNETVMKPGLYRDQWHFNKYIRKKALSGEKIRTLVLSNEIYNVRPWCWKHLKKQGKFGNVKILHAHHLHHGFFTKLKRKILSYLR